MVSWPVSGSACPHPTPCHVCSRRGSQRCPGSTVCAQSHPWSLAERASDRGARGPGPAPPAPPPASPVSLPLESASSPTASTLLPTWLHGLPSLGFCSLAVSGDPVFKSPSPRPCRFPARLLHCGSLAHSVSWAVGTGTTRTWRNCGGGRRSTGFGAGGRRPRLPGDGEGCG